MLAESVAVALDVDDPAVVQQSVEMLVPRTRGDEPAEAPVERLTAMCSPHTRGQIVIACSKCPRYRISVKPLGKAKDFFWRLKDQSWKKFLQGRYEFIEPQVRPAIRTFPQSDHTQAVHGRKML